MLDFANVTITPSDFVALVNQTLEFAYPSVVVEGELSSFRVSKGKWVYFDLKDAGASIRCFGTIYQLPGPLEDGMKVQVRAMPRLHPQFGFSLNTQTIQPVGEGAIKKAFELLMARLEAEGLFAADRKRLLPHPPQRIGLITSGESAAYADFIKIMHERWGGVHIMLADVQVQGEAAPAQLVQAIEYFNRHDMPPDVLVITRGGGSADDLFAFSTEPVVRAVAGSRIPTLVAIGHEVDTSLAELAADSRASTPSNAAQLLVPDRQEHLHRLAQRQLELGRLLGASLDTARRHLAETRVSLDENLARYIADQRALLVRHRQLLTAYDPHAALRRGYALLKDASGGTVIRSVGELVPEQRVIIELADGQADARIE